jgi:hypothetical protein
VPRIPVRRRERDRHRTLSLILNPNSQAWFEVRRSLWAGKIGAVLYELRWSASRGETANQDNSKQLHSIGSLIGA